MFYPVSVYFFGLLLNLEYSFGARKITWRHSVTYLWQIVLVIIKKNGNWMIRNLPTTTKLRVNAHTHTHKSFSIVDSTCFHIWKAKQTQTMNDIICFKIFHGFTVWFFLCVELRFVPLNAYIKKIYISFLTHLSFHPLYSRHLQPTSLIPSWKISYISKQILIQPTANSIPNICMLFVCIRLEWNRRQTKIRSSWFIYSMCFSESFCFSINL